MIPIDETKVIEKEVEGVIYSFLPISGENEVLHYRAMKCVTPEEIGNGHLMDKPENIQHIDALIDAVLVGWASKDKTVRPFPEHKKPSKCFRLTDKISLLNVICEINTIGEVERKN